MINNQYQLYQQSVFALAETIVIKFEGAADALNLQVIRDHGIGAFDEFDPHSWKYFQNIAGQYHFTDEPIYVNSLDVVERIVFSRENLAIHRATRAAYAFGTRYYEELLLQHPDKEMLIRGILYPANIDEAIAAKDGTILAYPSHLIEPWEYGLKKRLQDWIYGYLDRYVVKAFMMTDDLYCAAYMGQLYLHLIPAIMTFRKEACMTAEVHSFHLQQYLASHGYLDVFLPYLLRDQALFLYRNLNYLRRFAGKRDTFDWLVEKLLTRRGFPLYAYEMNHDVSAMARPNQAASSTLLPDVRFRRRSRSPLAKQNEGLDYSLEHVLAKVVQLAPGNSEYHQFEKENMRDEFAHAPSAVVKTKALESTLSDYSNAVAYPLENVVMNHWLAWAATGKYQANVVMDIDDVALGIRFTASEALVLFLYCLTQSIGKGIEGLPENERPSDRIPLIASSRITRNPKPTFGELRPLVPKKTLTDAQVHQVLDSAVLTPGSLLSIDSFYDACLAIYQATNYQFRLVAMQEHYITRGDMELLVHRLHEDRVDPIEGMRDPQDPTQGRLFTEWLDEMRLDFSSYTPAKFYELGIKVFNAATGMSTRTPTSMGLIQEMMVKLFLTLSSYSIQVVLDGSLQKVLVVPRPDVRIGDVPQKEKSIYYVDTAAVRVQALLSKVKELWGFDTHGGILDQAPKTHVYDKKELDTGLLIRRPMIDRWVKPLDTTLQFGSSEDFDEIAADLTPEQWSYLFDEYGYNPDRRSGFVKLSNIGRFIYTGGNKRVVPTRTIYENFTIPAFDYTGGTQRLPGYHFAARNKRLPGLKWTAGRTRIQDWVWYKEKKTLNGMRWSFGKMDMSPLILTAGNKRLPGLQFVGGVKRLNMVHSRNKKRLDGFDWTVGNKRLNGWSYLSNKGQTDV